MGEGRWTRDEFLVTLDLYLNGEGFVEDEQDDNVKEVASVIDRSNGSVALRLANYRHLDPNSTQGMENTGEKCREIWEEFYGNEEELTMASQAARERLEGEKTSETESEIKGVDTGEGTSQSKVRYGQKDFRKMVRERYNDECIICGIDEPGLLQAGHVLSWSTYEEGRGNPENGLLLCYNHHRAFDLGMFTISKSMKITVRPDFRPDSEILERSIIGRDGDKLEIENPPDKDLLEQHNTGDVYWYNADGSD